MVFSEQQIGSVSVLRATQALQGSQLETAQQQVKDCLSRQQAFLVLELSDCPLINSAGLEFIIDVQQICLRRGGRLVVADPQPLCAEILAVTGICDVVSVYEDLRAALGDFSQ